METNVTQTASRRRRQGQTLAEFAITLPTLLILVFGVIEFGRIFQAWVTLQNAARTGARYASTGQYYEDQFKMNTILNEAQPSDPDGFIPCVDDGPEAIRTYKGPAGNQSPSIDRRGTKTTVQPNGTGSTAVNIYTGGIESLFATWYDGRNCDPRESDDQERRKDMARILSIMLETRRGAAGLAIENDQWSVPSDKQNIAGNWALFPWFASWQTNPRPPRSDQARWFNVVVCSNRSFEDGSSSSYYNDGTPNSPNNRFWPYQGDSTLYQGANVVTPWAPSCLLNEVPAPTIDGKPNPLLANGGFSNAGQSWMDPGAPEDTVFVTVTFNHPLITPLRIASFIPLQARRSAIVETFRSAGNRKGTVFVAPIGANGSLETATATPTASPTFTNTPPFTNTPSPTPTVSKTPQGPFTCTLLSLSNKRLAGNQMQVDIANDNAQDTYITRVQLTWPNITAFAQMSLTQMSLNTVQNWVGNDPQNTAASTTTTDTDTKPGNPPFSTTSTSIRTISGGDSGQFGATFNIPPSTLLATYVTANQYAITVTLYNPLTPASPCILTSTATVVTSTPTVAGQPTATRTPTPDCASSLIGIKFNSFDNFGIVRYDILSQRTTTSTLVSVLINWKKYVATQRLVKVSLGAPPGQPGSVVVWDSGNVNQDSTPPTNSKTEGTWLTNYTIAAGAPGAPSITPIYFDFDGIYRYDDPELVASTNPLYGGPADFNFSEFELTCGTPGGSTGSTSGGQPTGKITPVNNPSPTPVPTQGPTKTPAPTLTPSKTPIPSATFTKGPPTATFTPKPPTATPPPTKPPTLAPPPTDANGNT